MSSPILQPEHIGSPRVGGHSTARRSPTHVVIINDAACLRGGADRVALSSALGLASRGCRVSLLTGFGPLDPSLRDVPNLSVHCLGTAWLRQQQLSPAAAFRGLWNRDAAVLLRRLLAPLDPADTVVHVHLYSSALTASVLHAAVSAGFATVLTLHDYFITCPNGAYFEFPRGVPCERRALGASCLACHCDSRRRVHKAWRVVRTWVQNRMARLPERITTFAAVSETCATLARRDLPAIAKIRVVPNIVDVAPRPPVPAARNRAFVFTGRLEAYKGPQLLAAAARRVGAPVVFCGSGPLEPSLREALPGARFTGWLPPSGVLAELANARAFVFPSVYRETFGLSAAEALAHGVPVIASRGTAAEDFVHHERNGLLFDRNAVDDLATQLVRLGDDATVERLGRTAHEDYWSAPLTLERHLAALDDVYAEALTSPRPRGRSAGGGA